MWAVGEVAAAVVVAAAIGWHMATRIRLEGTACCRMDWQEWAGRTGCIPKVAAAGKDSAEALAGPLVRTGMLEVCPRTIIAGCCLV